MAYTFDVLLNNPEIYHDFIHRLRSGRIEPTPHHQKMLRHLEALTHFANPNVDRVTFIEPVALDRHVEPDAPVELDERTYIVTRSETVQFLEEFVQVQILDWQRERIADMERALERDMIESMRHLTSMPTRRNDPNPYLSYAVSPYSGLPALYYLDPGETCPPGCIDLDSMSDEEIDAYFDREEQRLAAMEMTSKSIVETEEYNGS